MVDFKPMNLHLGGGAVGLRPACLKSQLDPDLHWQMRYACETDQKDAHTGSSDPNSRPGMLSDDMIS